MKGVLLAGGTGSRLYPLTRITNKHLLPIYDRPMIAWSIEALVNAGIDEIMLVTGGTHAGEFLRLLGNGHDYGIDRLSYAYQENAGGIAEALGLAERFVDGDPVLVMLADNIMERSIRPMVEAFR
ncbi:MAG TPA: sugar phosphate nucleotidyltransferase, partial [Acidimicrobiales bacterium]|nr:sugar phosphate nucleotidyltransferase [Acidimicrobiales bacterium]